MAGEWRLDSVLGDVMVELSETNMLSMKTTVVCCVVEILWLLHTAAR